MATDNMQKGWETRKGNFQWEWHFENFDLRLQFLPRDVNPI